MVPTLYSNPCRDSEVHNNDGCAEIHLPALDLHWKTTDRILMTSEGFQILGRTDFAINSGGVKIFPEDIEPKIADILESLRIYRSFYITSKTDDKLGQKVVLVLEGVRIQDTAFILEILKRELPPYHHPKEILFVQNIERTKTGKLIRLTW